MKSLISICFLLSFTGAFAQVDEYLSVIKDQGTEPISFVTEKLNQHDLIIFDDALHNAYEPFLFYEKLLASDTTIDFVFLEAFGINSQPHLDAFMAGETMDSTLLLPVFQSSFSGMGWPYESYYRLLKHIWSLNRNREKKVRAIGADQPIYWEGIRSRADYDIFRQSLIGRDHFMYRIILDQMENFDSDKKGIFLTNTRHAYKAIRNSKDELYWNCGTFFNQWHPGKSYSVRIHNVTLSISSKKSDKKNGSIDGLDRIEYRWVRMENGDWDQAFEANGNNPVAIPFKENALGNSGYIGNHMLSVAPNQTMSDAYDALIFLKPLESLTFSPKLSFYYTPAFKKELKRRIQLINEGNIASFLGRNEVASIDEFIEQLAKGEPLSKNDLLMD